jgi:hypothetical protein
MPTGLSYSSRTSLPYLLVQFQTFDDVPVKLYLSEKIIPSATASSVRHLATGAHHRMCEAFHFTPRTRRHHDLIYRKEGRKMYTGAVPIRNNRGLYYIQVLLYATDIVTLSPFHNLSTPSDISPAKSVIKKQKYRWVSRDASSGAPGRPGVQDRI